MSRDRKLGRGELETRMRMRSDCSRKEEKMILRGVGWGGWGRRGWRESGGNKSEWRLNPRRAEAGDH